ncbi:MAG: primosomal protein N' [Geopsychrobacter sp.]|nr:primosomal protein N' [Geopsychrobacter sp.]
MPELIADIAVFAPLRQLFSYRVPAELCDSILLGLGVQIPFGRRRLTGVVVKLRRGSTDKLKALYGLQDEVPLFDQSLLELCCWAADYYRYPVGLALRSALPAGVWSAVPRVAVLKDSLYRPGEETGQPRGSKQREVLEFVRQAKEASLSHLRSEFDAPHAVLERLVSQQYLVKSEIEKLRDPFLSDPISADEPLPLTSEQQSAFESLSKAVLDDSFTSFLLQGVTGSGKTEVYLQTIAEVLKQGRQGLVLVPEIALTPQLVGRFRARFEQAGYRIAVLHSGLSDGERFDAWRQIARDDIDSVIGARSAIFAPLQRPGLIIVDEEHESSYKQGEGFRYHARDLALLRGQKADCPVLLGSATPSLGSAYRCANGQMHKLELTRRAHAGDLPQVELIDLSGQPPEQFISEQLEQEIEATLAEGKQVLLLLNRRGFSPFLLCADCGQTFRCPNCEITLTYHQHARELRCHYCDYRITPPEQCPRCEGLQLDPEGFGTERLAQEMASLFPAARIARMDRDTTSRKGAHQKLVRQMMAREVDILVGTQMIAKGHDFPGVALVGVLASDAVLNLPDFRAAERAFSLLTQVAGRAGRTGGGRVLIQTYSPDHYALQFAAAQDYASFYAQEIVFRQELGYPPAGYLANLVFSGIGDQPVLKAAEGLVEYLLAAGSSAEILGPSPCPLARLRGKSRVQVLLKAENRPLLKALLDYAERWKVPAGVGLTVDVDPLDMF